MIIELTQYPDGRWVADVLGLPVAILCYGASEQEAVKQAMEIVHEQARLG